MHDQLAEGGLADERETLRLQHALERGRVGPAVPEVKHPIVARGALMQRHSANVESVDSILQEAAEFDVPYLADCLRHGRLLSRVARTAQTDRSSGAQRACRAPDCRQIASAQRRARQKD